MRGNSVTRQGFSPAIASPLRRQLLGRSLRLKPRRSDVLRVFKPQQSDPVVQPHVYTTGVIAPSVQAFLVEFGIERKEAVELLNEALDYWESESAEENLSLDRILIVLLTLLDEGIPIGELPKIVQKCPALLLASVDAHILPMFTLLKELKIRGTSLAKLCVSQPEVLIEGCPEAIRAIVKTFHRLGIHETQVHKLIRVCPSILMESVASFSASLWRLSQLFATEEDLVLLMTTCPQLLHDAPRRFQGVHGVMKEVGMEETETLECIRKEPYLLLKAPSRLKGVMDWFLECGLTHGETKSMLQSYPQLLIRRLPVLKEKAKFLVSVAKRPFHDVLSFPNYFHYAIDRTIGPRFTFLRERHNAALQTASLDALMRPTNQDFAEKVAKVLEAEYLVYQAQWTRMYGHKFVFQGRPSKQRD